MYRRKVMLGSGTTLATALAGCTGSLGGSEPQYDDNDKENLLLTIDDFPEAWNRDDEVNDNFDQVFLNEDETIIVLASVEIKEDIETAEERFDGAKSGTRDPQDYDIGDEGFWDTRNDEIAITLFRHSNAVGQVAAMHQSGMEVKPDQARSQDYAQEMFNGWNDV